jgi:hypothetical protein
VYHSAIVKALRVGGMGASFLVLLTLAYAVITVLGLLSLKSSQQPFPDPYFALMEGLIIIMAPVLVLVLAVVHVYAPHERKIYSLTALALILACAIITSVVHFVLLTVGRQPALTSVPWMRLFFSFTWPSVVYTLDILAWDWFYGLALLFAAPVFSGGRAEMALRVLLLLSGALSLAGLLFLPFDNINLRLIGVFGYAGLAPVVFLLLAIVLGRKAAHAGTVPPGIGVQDFVTQDSGTRPGAVDLRQERTVPV